MATNMFVRNMDLGAPNAADNRRLEVVVDGLPLFGGVQLAVDTTLVSAVQGDWTALPLDRPSPGPPFPWTALPLTAVPLDRPKFRSFFSLSRHNLHSFFSLLGSFC